MGLLNMTPHSVTIVTAGGDVVMTVPPCGKLVRLDQKLVPAGQLDIDGVSIPLMSNQLGDVTGLPDQVDGVFIIVSAIVKSAVPGRTDLVVPVDFVRDPAGAIIGCRALSI